MLNEYLYLSVRLKWLYGRYLHIVLTGGNRNSLGCGVLNLPKLWTVFKSSATVVYSL